MPPSLLSELSTTIYVRLQKGTNLQKKLPLASCFAGSTEVELQFELKSLAAEINTNCSTKLNYIKMCTRVCPISSARAAGQLGAQQSWEYIKSWLHCLPVHVRA